ncbi:hypothetical protein EW145_g435 [Phellinidium pouzarii]|uniref:Rho-GAP domain-containing protein n=1 Tax=Phellinidium pouzarii TaxID=167371 RepID=A0A4S4LIB9_9AGAM|nr:hypothetical protein EW145_g435 [Phellinidium pouzarii]
MASSVESASTPRTSTSENTLLGPIALFEQHLKFLQDSYLSFFQERAKIEEGYVDSLLRLHKRAKTMDTYLDHATEPSTVRQVWVEIRDAVEREAQSRMAFLQSLTVDVIDPITTLKETQDRTRKRIREDIKDSTLAHQDYAENALPRLKRTYFKRCQEVEDNKANAFAPSDPSGADTPVVLAPTRSNPNTSPVVTNPQPLRPLARRASGHHPQSRNRSPSASNPLHDLAHQGKRQLNQLMTFLDNKGGAGASGAKGDLAIRTVRAKREADEADKEYRKGVHWLETLRIRRFKILEGAFQSLEIFIDESSNKTKSAFDKYLGNLVATNTTISHLATHAQNFLPLITSQKDLAFLSTARPRYVKQSIPKRSLYTNYYVGDCSDLVFGVGLVDYATSRGLQEGDTPKIIRSCIAEVEKRGLGSEGIYRVSGRHAVVHEMVHKVEKDEKNFQFYPSDDIFVVASLLKQYLRELPEPVFKFPLEDRVKHSGELEEHIQNNFLFLRGKLRRLPAVHQATLKAIVEHLSHVAANSERNKMDPKNLAIIFGGVIFGEDDIPKAADLLSIQNWKDSLMEDLIINAHILFDERAAASLSMNSPPPIRASQLSSLTPVPIDERPASVDYGSSYTQISDVLPRQQSPDLSGLPNQDFTPELPARPGNSIHPSRRVAVLSSRVSSETDEEANPTLPALPVRPASIEVRAARTSEGSTTGSLISPFSERHDESFADTESTTPSVAPSSPASFRSPLVGVDEMASESHGNSQHPTPRRSQEETSVVP